MRANRRNPKPNATETNGPNRGPDRAPEFGCAFATDVTPNVTVVFTADPAGVRVAGLKPHARYDGWPEQAKLTVPVKLLIGVTVSVAFTGAELVSVPLLGLMVSEKSGGGGTVMVTVTAADVEPEKAVAPPYCAVMESLPAGKVVVEKVATPAALREPVPIEVAPS